MCVCVCFGRWVGEEGERMRERERERQSSVEEKMREGEGIEKGGSEIGGVDRERERECQFLCQWT